MISRHLNWLTVSMALLLLPACEQKAEKSPTPAKPEAKTETSTPEAKEKPTPAATTQPAGAPMKKETEAAKPAAAGKNPRVVLSTTKGDIVLELDQAKAPITVANFLQATSTIWQICATIAMIAITPASTHRPTNGR